MQNIITDEIVISYTQCKRKAFLLLNGKQGKPKEIISAQEQKLEAYKSGSSPYFMLIGVGATTVNKSSLTVHW